MRRSRLSSALIAASVVLAALTATTTATAVNDPASNTDTHAGVFLAPGTDYARETMLVVPEDFHPEDYANLGTDTISLYQQSAAIAPRWLQRKHPALAADASRAAVATDRAGARGIGTYNNSPFVPGTFGQHLPTFCEADGTTGNRVQAMYVREASDPDRYAAVKNVLIEEMRTITDAVYVSGIQTGGGRQVRWVTDASCNLSILNVTVPNGALDTWTSGIDALANQGYTADNRKYLMFADEEADSGIGCGLGTTYADDRPTGNLNDTKVGYARIDSLCWTRGENNYHSTALHELGHALGAVLRDAPNSTGAGHCVDEYDVMCYADGGPNITNTNDPLRFECPTVLEDLFDCNGDDYFNVNPAPGSWLATHWNVANSSFLADDGIRPGSKVTLASTGPDFPEAGDEFTLTANHTDTSGAAYRWTSNAPSCITSGASARTVTVKCTDFSGPLNVTVEVKKANGAIVLATRDINIGSAQGTFGEITGPRSAGIGQTFTLTGAATQGKAPFTYRWDAFDARCTLLNGSRTTASITLSCVREGGPDEIVDFRLAITGADGSVGIASYGVAILNDGGGGGGGGDDETPVVTLLGPTSTTPLVPARITATADRPVSAWDATDDQADCFVNQVNLNVWDAVCAENFSGTVTVTVTASTNTGQTGTATRTISVTRNGGGGADAVVIEGSTQGTAGRQLTLSAQATGAPVAAWRWTLTNPACQHGRMDTATVTVWCDAETVGNFGLTVQGTTGAGETLSDTTTINMVRPAVNVFLSAPMDPLEPGENVNLKVSVTENGTGTPLKARIGLERSRDDGRTWITIKAPSVINSGALTHSEEVPANTLYRATGAGSMTTADVIVNGAPAVAEAVRVSLGSAKPVRQGHKFVGGIDSASGAGLTGMTVKVQFKATGTRKWKVLTTTTSQTGGKIVATAKVPKRGDVRFKSVGTDRYKAGKSNRVRVLASASRAARTRSAEAPEISVRPNAVM